ncbi:alpha/beta hydrolase [Nocardia sp. NBC_00565]|uniref:alpha/beta hydrolase n=1 Tax=Nocardia sp. NBC_00565 TaxID=2975993 RepID=UPI002E80B1FB|nr:alpha/beta hydrolase [Nocardia sp. NBC_00565]WUC05092.1 alpha/beta hydrolase [Nocardia sp. NBC_00565]
MSAGTVEEHFQRIPYSPAADGKVEIHSGLSRHYPTLHANLVTPPRFSRDLAVVMAHPSSNFLSHFLLNGFAEAGIPIMGLNTRYACNEAALLMERAAQDLGAGVRWLREELGFQRVVLLGFSGGGSLASFYQGQAENPTVTATPSGDAVSFEDLVPADGIMLVGAHPGRARVLANWIDPSVVREDDPYRSDPELGLYAPERELPLSAAWVTRYRAAQRRRIDRIDAWVLEQLERTDVHAGSDRAFVVHRTVADPRFVDVSLDPSDRKPGSMYGDPAAANWSAGGLARFVTARSWLSTWSINHSRADALSDLTSVKVPTVVMALRGDQAAFVSESRQMHAASADPSAEIIEIAELDHYLVDKPEGLGQIIAELLTWLRARGLTD